MKSSGWLKKFVKYTVAPSAWMIYCEVSIILLWPYQFNWFTGFRIFWISTPSCRDCIGNFHFSQWIQNIKIKSGHFAFPSMPSQSWMHINWLIGDSPKCISRWRRKNRSGNSGFIHIFHVFTYQLAHHFEKKNTLFISTVTECEPIARRIGVYNVIISQRENSKSIEIRHIKTWPFTLP